MSDCFMATQSATCLGHEEEQSL